MSFRSVAKACARALLYFLIFLAAQFLVVNWFTFGASFVLSYRYGAEHAQEFMSEDMENVYLETVENLTNELVEMVGQYELELTIASDAAAVAAVILIFRIRKKKVSEELGFRPVKPARLLILIPFGAALNVFTSLGISVIPFPEAWVDNYAESVEALDKPLALMIIATVIAAPIAEEIFFRGLVESRLKTGMPMLAAMIVSAWLFGLVHVSPIWILYAALLGFVLVWTAEKYGSIWASLVVHMAYNAANLPLVMLGEIDDGIFYAMLAGSGVLSVLLALCVDRIGGGKIEARFHPAENETKEC